MSWEAGNHCCGYPTRSPGWWERVAIGGAGSLTTWCVGMWAENDANPAADRPDVNWAHFRRPWALGNVNTTAARTDRKGVFGQA